MNTLEDYLDIENPRESNMITKISSFYRKNISLWKAIGSHFKTPETYLYEFKIRFPEVIIEHNLLNRGLNFVNNKERPIHRWTSYLEGFSDNFVYEMIDQFKLNSKHIILDPFAGSGTLNVCAMMKGIDSIGIEINPTIYRILETKTCWKTDPKLILDEYNKMDFSGKPSITAPSFMKVNRQFNPEILKRILKIKEEIEQIENSQVKSYFNLAFMTILLPSSNLRRSPSIGYDKRKTKNLYPELPLELFKKKIEMIVKDLRMVRKNVKEQGSSMNFCEDSKVFSLPEDIKVDAVITSPPYLNSFDYVGNYKLEIGWMGDAKSTKDMRELRDQMVLCDNVSRKMMKEYAQNPPILSIDWLDYLIAAVEPRMRERLGIRRKDYPILLRKYFEDIYYVLQRMYESMKSGAKVAWVVGDSLILDVYIPTDLLTMVIANVIGYKLRRIEIDRVRRSGIRRSFILRESVLFFEK